MDDTCIFKDLKNTSYAALHFKSRTKTKNFKPGIPVNTELCQKVNGMDEKYKPTHVVTALTYGGDAHITFEHVSEK